MLTEQRRLTLTFKDPGLERNYQRENARKSVFQVQLASLMSTILYAGFILLDRVFFTGDAFPVFLYVRLAVSAVLFICFILSFKMPHYVEGIVLTGVIVAQAGHMVLMYYAGSITDYGYAVSIILLVFLFTFSRIKYRTALILLGLFLAAYEWMVIAVLEYPVEIILKNNYFLLSVSIACMLSGYVIERYIRSDYIQTLKMNEKNAIIKLTNLQLMQELLLARRIQESMIPSQEQVFSGIEVAAFYQPMEAVGGDFYDFVIMCERQKTGIFISDVSGHGIPAALITSMVKTLLDSSGTLREHPGELLSFINTRLYGQTGGNFLTAFYGIYNRDTSVFTYSRGAHNFPILIRGNSLTTLQSQGRILGIFSDLIFEESIIDLQPGDRIIFYTDGLTEAINATGIEFETMLPEILLSTSGSSIQELIKDIREKLLAHRGGMPFEDDVCIIAWEISAA